MSDPRNINAMTNAELRELINNQRKMIHSLQMQLTRALECVAANHSNNRLIQQERTF